jgi:formylglycine-generating enzyme required for sulfatase activity
MTLNAGDANFDETYGKKPSALGPDEVGSFPASVSPFGVYDMAGNVWELVKSWSDKEGFASRGGAFFFDQLNAYSTNRLITTPKMREPTVGVRVCARVLGGQ